MYAQTIPYLLHHLRSLAAILRKGEAHCEARKIDKQVMLNLRLAADMFPLVRQVQIVTDAAKGCGARLSGSAIPSYPDVEQTFDELQARIAKTIAFLESLAPGSFDGAETRSVTVKVRGEDRNFPALDYVYKQAWPNFFFHMTTAYNILRHHGVELGKGDFLGLNQP